MNRIKWFSHDNDASEDEWMHELIREFGPAGYGRYWILIENFDRHRKGEEWATSWAFVREKLRTRSGEVRKLLDFFRGSGKVLSEEVGEKLVISIPKFIEKQAKLRANFYSKLREDIPDLAIDKTRLEGDKKENKQPLAQPSKKVAPKEEPILTFPCSGDKSEWHLYPSKEKEWQASFPGLIVLQECKKARQWIMDNPTKRKTHNGMTRFLGAWLGRVQNSGGSNAKSGNGGRIVGGAEPTEGKYDDFG